MMRKPLAFSLFLIILSGQIFARPVKRIKFARGATEAIVAGKLKGYNDRQIYLLRVRAGQTLKTAQIKSDSSLHYITVSIKDPNGQAVGDSDASCNNRKEISPTASGDYRIEVFECRKADPWRGNFKLLVSVK